MWEIVIYGKLVVGFLFLIKGADLLVEGAGALARRFNVPDIVIGLTVVSFGTSAPELVVNLFASVQGSSDLAVSNILGSNIANILLILGTSSLIYPLSVLRNTVWKEIPLSLLAALVLGVMANDRYLDASTDDILSRADGLVLIAFFSVFLYYTFEISRSGAALNGEEIHSMGNPRSLLYLVLGLAGLTVGGDWIVDGASHMALTLGLSENLVGLTIVAIGTSLPELAASVVASLKQKADIAVGNAVGSNIFNIFWVLGVSSFIKPIPFSASSNQDISMTVLASLLLFLFLFIGVRHRLSRLQGGFFLFLYTGYLAFLVVRG